MGQKFSLPVLVAALLNHGKPVVAISENTNTEHIHCHGHPTPVPRLSRPRLCSCPPPVAVKTEFPWKPDTPILSCVFVLSSFDAQVDLCSVMSWLQQERPEGQRM